MITEKRIHYNFAKFLSKSEDYCTLRCCHNTGLEKNPFTTTTTNLFSK